MTKKTVLYELLDDNERRIRQMLDEDEHDFLYWSPDQAGNSVAVTIWHVARVHDIFLIQHIHGKSAEAEIWIASG